MTKDSSGRLPCNELIINAIKISNYISSMEPKQVIKKQQLGRSWKYNLTKYSLEEVEAEIVVIYKASNKRTLRTNDTTTTLDVWIGKSTELDSVNSNGNYQFGSTNEEEPLELGNFGVYVASSIFIKIGEFRIESIGEFCFIIENGLEVW